MSANTSIEWTERTWNPVRGCSIVSPGCVNCYAMKQAHRFSGPGKPYEGLTKQTKAGPQWTGVVRTVDEALLEPLSWRKPARIFVNSMSDLFHEQVPDAFIDCVFNVMAFCPQHTFQVLTKRPDRMLRYLSAPDRMIAVGDALCDSNIAERLGRDADTAICLGMDRVTKAGPRGPVLSFAWPLSNVWLGVSCENQQTADERIPLLLQTPAAVRWVSAEPLLGPIDFIHPRDKRDWLDPQCPRCSDYNDRCGHERRIDWVVVGGESGPGARPFDLAWARSIVQQCKSAGVPVFVKQLGAEAGELEERFAQDAYGEIIDGSEWHAWPTKDRKGGDPSEWPQELRVREYPQLEVTR